MLTIFSPFWKRRFVLRDAEVPCGRGLRNRPCRRAAFLPSPRRTNRRCAAPPFPPPLAATPPADTGRCGFRWNGTDSLFPRAGAAPSEWWILSAAGLAASGALSLDRHFVRRVPRSVQAPPVPALRARRDRDSA